MSLAIPASTDSVRDRHIAEIRPLVSPALLRDELPLSDDAARVVTTGRDEVTDILDGRDDRLLVVVGPCSVHDPDAALTYARRLAELAQSVGTELRIVMRVYFEKPRTTLGWKGLINDPELDGSFQVNKGLRLARKLLLDILDLGLPVGCEFLDPITPQYISDTVSWGSIGARTAQSQVHRQLSSGLSMPIGIKNGTDGDVQVAVDAVAAAGSSHVFTGITDGGLAAILRTTGNPDCHVVLRGSSAGPNYDAATIATTMDLLRSAGLPARAIVDASHGNSGKDHRRQPVVAGELAERLAGGEQGLVGVMLESFLVEGRQNVVAGEELRYGQSITDACMSWESTESTLRTLADAVARRRGAAAG
ncbi:3-deoxy-7-phosphoheptulonate synthase [Actinoalloteichus hymeniacidonis]|uniref:Phospho-2-dehydro-3-deoxyheptonate aldolase n=1 Tax=Actinoalloteichus hymeniacidonis TaxID=340345 RepID=A0AAC9HN90_9PSEU|nr:3-deoxy-7-phosphoheptulonate synthase [Actinoalloteichus hymeniacidonis]AOS62472.1 3-deoxy-D-arabinoheptulosonate-7-phosphate synthase [Actinoalloteichus hymeniacidonis]MBB5909497.1 3-deoxy-7-phosphoheptulonate synthase [Actinoalloteichus hymeniacidonis]